MSDLVYVGYFSGVFGLKGALKVVSDEIHLDKIFKNNNCLIIDNKDYIILKSMYYKGKYLITLKGYEDINLINDFLKKDIYVKRDNINLGNDEYLLSDLEKCKVIFENKDMGNVLEILKGKSENYIKINNIIVPLNERYIQSIDILGKMIYAKNIGELDI